MALTEQFDGCTGTFYKCGSWHPSLCTSVCYHVVICELKIKVTDQFCNMAAIWKSWQSWVGKHNLNNEITFDGPVPPEWKSTPNAANTTTSLCSNNNTVLYKINNSTIQLTDH